MDTSIKNKICSCPASERHLWIDYMDQLRKNYVLCHPDYQITGYDDNPKRFFLVLGKPIEKSTILTHLMLEPAEFMSFEQKKQRLDGIETCSRMMGQGLYLTYPYKKIDEKHGLGYFEKSEEYFPEEAKKKYEGLCKRVPFTFR